MRSKILLDELDMKIMKSLRNKPSGIMALKEEMGLRHPSLKAHLTRLHEANLIKRTPVPKSRKIMLSVPKRKGIKTIFQTFG